MGRSLPPRKLRLLALLIEEHFDHDALKRAVPPYLHKSLQHYSTASSLPSIIFELVTQVSTEEKIDELAQGLRGENESADLREGLDELLATGAAVLGANGAPRLLLIEETPPLAMVNRRTFRSNLDALLASDGYKFLSVAGPSPCGKTHSWHLIRKIADERGFMRWRADLQKYQDGAPIAVILEEIVTRLLLPLAEFRQLISDNPSAAQAVSRFVTWLGPHSQAFPSRRILVLDGVDRRHAVDVRNLLVPQLLVEMAQGNIENIYLVLLGDNATRIAEAARKTLHEDPQVINADDIQVFIGDYATEKGWTLVESDLKALTDWVVGPAVYPFDHAALDDISRRLGHLIERLRKLTANPNDLLADVGP